MKGSLVIVGTGIKFVSHLTVEARVHIEEAQKVLYLVNEPAMQQWIEKTNPASESLDPLYAVYPLRLTNYRAITEYILNELRKNQSVCVALYGHPTVFAQPALDAAIQAKKEGYASVVLPGISAADCLFADLLIDFGNQGCQLIEATELLINQRKLDPSSHVILWQVGMIGVLGHRPTDNNNNKGLMLLVNYLHQFYSSDHQVTLYEAAQYPGFQPTIIKQPLSDLSKTAIPRLATLYIPPEQTLSVDEKMLAALEINMEDLR